MLSAYLLCLGLGSTLILVSLFFGGADKDFDKDFDVDHDLDVDQDLDVDVDHDLDVDVDHDLDLDHDLDAGDADVDLAGGLDAHADVETAGGGLDKDLETDSEFWLPLLSMRFWTFGMAMFGLTGTLLSFLSIHWLIAFAMALTVGVGIGWGMATLFRTLKSESVSAPVSLASYRGDEARVLLAIRPGGVGKITLQGPDGRVEMMARSEAGTVIERNETVIVVAVQGDIAEVAPLSPEADVDELRALQAAKAKRQTQ